MNENLSHMSNTELQSVINQLKDVDDYFNRPEASYEEKCFSEQIRALSRMYSTELSSRTL